MKPSTPSSKQSTLVSSMRLARCTAWVLKKLWTFSTTLRYFLSSKKELPTFIAEATSIWLKRFGENEKK